MSGSLPPAFTPDFLRQLELLKLRARRAFLGTRQGGHQSPKRGHGIEFSDYRTYEPGDDPRHIDWSVYARNERLYVKVFQEEQDVSVLLIVDGSPSMLTPEQDRKWETARDIAIALSYVALLQQDRVMCAVPGVFTSPFYQGGAAVHRLGRELNALRFTGGHEVLRGVQQAAARMRFPGIAVLISDFLMPFSDVEAICNVLRAKNLDITAVQVLGANDLKPLEQHEHVLAIDSETGEQIELSLNAEARADYDDLLAEHNERLQTFFASAQIAYAHAAAADGVRNFVIHKLANTALLQ